MKNSLLLLLFLVCFTTYSQNPSCNANQFYGVGNSGTAGVKKIYSFTKNASSITYNGAYVSSIPGGSLAIANLGNGEHFYTNQFDFQNNIGTIQEYDGTNWNVVYTGPRNFQNAAGKGNYLYFHNISTSISANEIVRFDGTNLITIWNDQSVIQPCADINVDNNGNVYFFTGSTYIANTLNVISPTGTMLAQIPISFEGFTGYGICFLNDVFHIVFQGSNSQFPNKLVPILISGNTATLGSPIDMPQPIVGTATNGPIYLAMSDLASCASANVALANPNFEFAQTIQLYSNNNQLTVHSKEHGIATIYNIHSQEIVRFAVEENLERSVDVSNLAKGLYLVVFKSNGETAIKKFLKQ